MLESPQVLWRQPASGHQFDESPRSLPGEFVSDAHNDAVADWRIHVQLVAQNAGLNLSGPDAMAVHVEDIVGSTMHEKAIFSVRNSHVSLKKYRMVKPIEICFLKSSDVTHPIGMSYSGRIPPSSSCHVGPRRRNYRFSRVALSRHATM